MKSLLTLFLVFAVNTSFSQETVPVAPPKFPISLRAPENSAWTISSSRKDKTEDGEPSLETLSVTKTGPIYHERAEGTNGRGWEKWVFMFEGEPLQVIKFAGDAKWNRLPRTGASSEWSNYVESDFEEFQWIGEANYKGVDAIDERPAHVFETNTNHGPLTRKEALAYDYGKAADAVEAGRTYGTNLVVHAYIDPQKSLPMRIDNGVEVRDYTFGEPPPARQQPPFEVLAEFTKWVTEIRATQR